MGENLKFNGNQLFFDDDIVTSQALQEFFDSNSLCCAYTQTSTQESNQGNQKNEQSSHFADISRFIFILFERNEKLIIFFLNISMIIIVFFQLFDLLYDIFFK